MSRQRANVSYKAGFLSETLVKDSVGGRFDFAQDKLRRPPDDSTLQTPSPNSRLNPELVEGCRESESNRHSPFFRRVR